MRLRLATAFAALMLVAAAAPAHAAQPERASLSDIEDEVMCLICGTPLSVSDSPQADRERALIRTLIARGETKKQIKDALVAQYGRAVLATPSDKGFDLAAWVVPGLAVLLAGIAIAFAVVRWRRVRTGAAGAPLAAAARPGADDRARLRSDLEHYDL
jgi:cytochrome c-type biogenesis protein CcmH